jgi:hypothetical protein
LQQVSVTAQAGQVTAIHLIRLNPQALGYHPALELGGKEPVIPTQ